jgi:hypothetical protein
MLRVDRGKSGLIVIFAICFRSSGRLAGRTTPRLPPLHTFYPSTLLHDFGSVVELAWSIVRDSAASCTES